MFHLWKFLGRTTLVFLSRNVCVVKNQQGEAIGLSLLVFIVNLSWLKLYPG